MNDNSPEARRFPMAASGHDATGVMSKIPRSLLDGVIAEQPYPLLFVTISGAHLYGFASPDSDYDLRGVHMLPASDVCGLYEPRETITFSDVREEVELDCVTHDVSKFFQMILKRNGYVLEQLYSPLVLQTTPEHEALKSIGRNCITRHHAHHYLGFGRRQWDLFKKDQRLKPLLYTYRVLLTGIYLMQSREVEANLVRLNEVFRLGHLDELIVRKLQGRENDSIPNADIDFHQRELERLTGDLERARDISSLPDLPSGKAALNDLLLRLRFP